MDKIRVVSWLLTRRCNLRCGYCSISREYSNMPYIYENMKYYLKNEMSTPHVLNILKSFKKHNPDCFHIFYGGEPLLRDDLKDIINYCNQENIMYTIISNCSDLVKPKIEKLLTDTGNDLRGFTGSVDPVIISHHNFCDDAVEKSKEGLIFLELLKKRFPKMDVVAEITVGLNNYMYLYDLIKILSDRGIVADITFIDVAKTDFYDFSNISDETKLVYKTKQLEEILNRIIQDKLNVHMAEKLLPEIYNILPSNLDCEIENGVHNLTIDSDGKVRLCLRIRGDAKIILPKEEFDFDNLPLKQDLSQNKRNYCRLCNWTCMIMSKIVNHSEENNLNNLLHI